MSTDENPIDSDEPDAVAANEASAPPQNSADDAEPDREKSRILPVVLITLATLLAIVGSLTTWVKVQMLDTDQWVSISEGLLDEPEVRDALSVYIVDVVYEQIDVSGEVEQMLPEGLTGLAGPLSAALRSPATSGVERILDSPAFRGAWLTANRVAHQTMVNILRDETRTGTSITDGVVTLEIGDMIRMVGESLGLPADALDRIPEDAGRIVIFESDELESAQEAVQVLDFLSWFVFLVVVVLYALAVFAGRNQLYRTLRKVGYGLMIAGVAVLVFRSIGIEAAVGAFVQRSSNESVVETVAYVATGLLRQTAVAGIAVGLLLFLFAALMGEGSRALAGRRVMAPALNSSAVAVAGGTLVGLLLLVWWSPGRIFERTVTTVTVLVLVIAGVVALRARTLSESPDATLEDSVGSFKSGAGSTSGGSGSSAPDGAGSDSMTSELGSLRELHADGGLTDEEFAAAKQSVLTSQQNADSE